MRLAISGSRDWPNSRIEELVRVFTIFKKQHCPEGTEIGDARGVDTILYEFLVGAHCDVNKHKAHWNKLNNYAGHERNSRVLENADALLAFPLGEAKGTNNCIKQALTKGIPVYIYQNGEVKLHHERIIPYEGNLFG